MKEEELCFDVEKNRFKGRLNDFSWKLVNLLTMISLAVSVEIKKYLKLNEFNWNLSKS